MSKESINDVQELIKVLDRCADTITLLATDTTVGAERSSLFSLAKDLLLEIERIEEALNAVESDV